MHTTDDDAGRSRGPAKRVHARRFRASVRPRRGLRCQDMVELVTTYLDAAQPTTMRRRFEQHLRGCVGCNAYLDEVRDTVATVRLVGDEDLDPAFRARLLDAFAATAGPR